jgi:hypothetical protein
MFGWGEKKEEEGRRCKFGGKWVIYIVWLGRKDGGEVN